MNGALVEADASGSGSSAAWTGTAASIVNSVAAARVRIIASILVNVGTLRGDARRKSEDGAVQDQICKCLSQKTLLGLHERTACVRRAGAHVQRTGAGHPLPQPEAIK